MILEHDLERLELSISRFLRIGALGAGLLLLAGWTWRLGFTSTDDANPFAPFATHVARSLVLNIGDAWTSGDIGLLIEYVGLGALISLPVLRVAFVAALFARGRDRILACAAGVFLCGLALSLALGFEV